MFRTGKISISITFLFLIISVFSFAQKKQLTFNDAMYMNPEVHPKRVNQLMWVGNSNEFSFVENNTLYKSKANAEEKRSITNLDDLNAGLTDLEIDSLKRFPSIHYLAETKFRFTHKNNLFVYDLISRDLERVNKFPDKAKSKDIIDETLAIAYTIDNNLYIALNNEQLQISNDDNSGIVNGQTVHRNEFGINKGTFWSPNGNYLAFYRKDETMVSDYPIVDIETRIAEVSSTKYPMAGMKSEEVILGVYNLNSKQTVFIKTGEPKEQYLTSVTWDPTEKFIYIALLNRDQNHLKLNKYDIKSGEFVQTLFEEKHENYVEPEHPMYFLDSHPGQFVWFSERDGFNHLYLYDQFGTMIKQLTKGEWVVTNFLGTDKKGKKLFFTATIDSPIEEHIYSVEMSSDKITKINQDKGSHNSTIRNGRSQNRIVSFSGQYILDDYSSSSIAHEVKVLDTKGKVIQTILPNFNPLQEYNMGEMTISTLKAEDGTDLYYRLIKPVDFDENKKYPVFLYVYGGPHSQLVSESWLGGAGLYLNYMAAQGYVVFTLDNRGTSHRGLAFEQATFRNLGELEVADQMKGVEFLKSLDYVDSNRIGVFGWSYGGFMTISMMLKNPGVFHTGVAGGPVTDWKYYEVMYGERYMDRPSQNPDGYGNSSLLTKTDQLDGNLMIIHGTSDSTVVWQHSLAFVKKCIDEGKQLDYFVYPGHGHGVRGKDRLHLYEKVSNYFEDHLK